MAGIGLDRVEEVLRAEPDQELGLGRGSEVGQAGGRRGSLDRGHVDVGGEVLAPDVGVWIVVDPVPEIGAERAVATPDRVVQLGGGIAVVDDEEDPATEAGRRVADPRVDREADLGALPVGEGDTVVGKAGRQRGRRRICLDIDEPVVA